MFDIRDGMAAVRFKNKECGVVDDNGGIVWKKGGCLSVMFTKNHFLTVRKQDGYFEYIDLYSLREYRRLPEVRRFGDVEMLKIGSIYYSRTKKTYVNRRNLSDGNVFYRSFFVAIFDYEASVSLHTPDPYAACFSCGYVCLLSGDHDSYYRICRWLADGSIIVADGAWKLWHVADGGGKKYVGCCDSEEETQKCTAEMKRITERAEEARKRAEAEKSEKRLCLLEKSGDAVPFRSGMKWGLKVGGRVTVPPVYHNIRPPVGRYCAVEKSYSRWGVVAVDGTVMVEPQYSDIEIGLKGDVTRTKVTGSKVSVKLP